MIFHRRLKALEKSPEGIQPENLIFILETAVKLLIRYREVLLKLCIFMNFRAIFVSMFGRIHSYLIPVSTFLDLGG